MIASGRRLAVWWDGLPDSLLVTWVPTGEDSNIHPGDYVGPESCRECHLRNYQSWSAHPHRWMNARATPEAVKGDFSGTSEIVYRGGRANFSRQGNDYFMQLDRGGVRRRYAITQTIGSRFYQRYVGKQLEGPESPNHHFYTRDHVLPFSYWLEQKEWVPLVHIGPEKPDDERPDPFLPPDRGIYYAEYAVGCNACHTTFPLADLIGRRPALVGEHAPVGLHWSAGAYFETVHPDVYQAIDHALEREQTATNPTADWDASQHAASLGVSCEACHLGARAHVESRGRVPPQFFPASPYLFMEAREAARDRGRSHDNVNWACGRCHTGTRPQFAAGMSTWNSVEYADAVRGSCYSKLRCVDCHNPHRAIGRKWALSGDQDDALCFKCHEQFQPAAARVKHTHHPMGSEGARCMNCHMPRINEGLRDVVRTHMIYSPTRADMLEANHPNTCNLCHLSQPIDWTLRYLKEWYGGAYNESKIAAHYPNRSGPVAQGWLKSDNPAVRLVAGQALIRAGDRRSLLELLDALDDPYLVNRQFVYQGLQEMLNVRLRDFGYRFYMTSEERQKPLADLRRRFSKMERAAR
jgi:predicted CXXCH cytochrome family protein